MPAFAPESAWAGVGVFAEEAVEMQWIGEAGLLRQFTDVQVWIFQIITDDVYSLAIDKILGRFPGSRFDQSP